MTNDEITVVPMGCNCFPRVSAVALGLKPRKNQGELSYPFDLGIWPIPMVRFLIENDFEGMTDPANLFVRPDPFGQPILCDKRFPSCSYNHEMPPATDIDFVGDNYARFVERYNRRIQNFRTTLAAKKRVLLYMTATNLLPPPYNPFAYEDFHAIVQTLKTRYPNTQFRLLVVIERLQFSIPDSWNNEIYTINIPVIGPYTLCFPYIQAVLGIRCVFQSIFSSYR